MNFLLLFFGFQSLLFIIADARFLKDINSVIMFHLRTTSKGKLYGLCPCAMKKKKSEACNGIFTVNPQNSTKENQQHWTKKGTTENI